MVENVPITDFESVGPTKLPVALNEGAVEWFSLRLFRAAGNHYLCLSRGLDNPDRKGPCLVRIESACTFAHIFGSRRCDCEWQLRQALSLIAKEGYGLVIYALDQHGRGVGLWNHVRVYQREDAGLPTDEAHRSLGLPVDARQYDGVLRIVGHYGLQHIRLLTNNPRRLDFMRQAGFVVERVPLEAPVDEYNRRELVEKRLILGHLLSIDLDE